MTSPRPASVKTRRAVFLYWRYETPHGWRMKCQCGCETEFNPASEKWEADHEIVRAHLEDDEPPNVRPLLYACHRAKSGKDKTFIAKGKRQSDSVYGVKRPSSKLRKPKGAKWNWSRRRYEYTEPME